MARRIRHQYVSISNTVSYQGENKILFSITVRRGDNIYRSGREFHCDRIDEVVAEAIEHVKRLKKLSDKSIELIVLMLVGKYNVAKSEVERRENIFWRRGQDYQDYLKLHPEGVLYGKDRNDEFCKSIDF